MDGQGECGLLPGKVYLAIRANRPDVFSAGGRLWLQGTELRLLRRLPMPPQSVQFRLAVPF